MKSGIVALMALAISLFAVLGEIARAQDGEGLPALEVRLAVVEDGVVALEAAVAAQDLVILALQAHEAIADVFHGNQEVNNQQSAQEESILAVAIGALALRLTVVEDLAADHLLEQDFNLYTIPLDADNRLQALETFHP